MVLDGATVLLVEFNSELRRGVARRLSAAGYFVVEAHNSQAARIAVVKSGVDLIVVDRTLPRGEDGLELVPRLRSECGKSSIPAIVLDANPPDDDVSKRSRRIGGVSFVVKPVDHETLLEAVHVALRLDTASSSWSTEAPAPPTESRAALATNVSTAAPGRHSKTKPPAKREPRRAPSRFPATDVAPTDPRRSPSRIPATEGAGTDPRRAPSRFPATGGADPFVAGPKTPPDAVTSEHRSSRDPVVQQIETPLKLKRPDVDNGARAQRPGSPFPGSQAAGGSRRPALIPLGPSQWPAGHVARFTFQRNSLPGTGTLAEWNIAEMVHGCFSESITGRLKFWHDSVIKLVYLSRGLPVFVESDLPDETLGAFLVRRGTIDEARHRELAGEMLRRGCKLGELLLAHAVMSPHDLSAAITAHLLEKVSSLFSWEDGRFMLERGDRWLEGIFSFKMEPARVLLDGVQAHFSGERVAAEFPLPDEARPYLRHQTMRRIPTLPLTTREARVFRYIGREAPIGEIVGETAVTREEVIRILYAFYVMELIGIEIGRSREEHQGDVDEHRDSEIPAAPRPAAAARPVRNAPPTPGPSASRRSRDSDVPVAAHPERPRESSEVSDRRKALEREVRADYLRLMDTDYFTILGIRPTAHLDEIRRAFRIRVQNLRPHMLVGLSPEARAMAQELYQKVTEAYLVLEDEELRKRYLESQRKPEKARIQEKRREQVERDDSGSFSVLLSSDVSSLWHAFFGKDKKKP